MSKGVVHVTGTVRRLALEGGLWVLDTDSGGQYQLTGGGTDLYEDGVRASVTGRVDGAVVSLGMAGDILEVESYQIG